MALYAIYMKRYGSPYYVGGSDDRAFELLAKEVALSTGVLEYSSIRGNIVSRTYPCVGYVYLVSLLYRVGELLGGFHTMLPRLFNAMSLGLVSVFTYLLGKRYHLSRRVSMGVAFSVGLFPMAMYTAAHTFRDVLTSLLTIWVVYIWSNNFDRFRLRHRLWSWVQTLAIVGVLDELRTYQAVATLAIALVGDLLSSRQRFGQLTKANLYRLAVLVVCIVALFVFQQRLAWFGGRLERAQEGYSQYRIGLSDGLAAYVFSAPAPLTYVLRVSYALISPLPILSGEVERVWLSAGTVFQFFFLPFLAVGFVRSIRDRTKWLLLTAFGVLFLGVALISFAGRHIVQFLPYGALIAGIGFERYRKYRMPVWVTAGWVGMVLALTYIALKVHYLSPDW